MPSIITSCPIYFVFPDLLLMNYTVSKYKENDNIKRSLEFMLKYHTAVPISIYCDYGKLRFVVLQQITCSAEWARGACHSGTQAPMKTMMPVVNSYHYCSSNRCFQIFRLPFPLLTK